MRGLYLGVCLVLFVSLLSGCFKDEAPAPEPTREAEPEEDLVPRVFEPGALPVPLRYRASQTNVSEATFTGSHPPTSNPQLYDVPGTELARIALTGMIPSGIPVNVTVSYAEHGWMGVDAELEVDEGRFAPGGSEGSLLSLTEESWYVWREGDAPVTLVVRQASRGGCICYPPQDWLIHVNVFSDPGRLPAHVPTLVALDPTVPVLLEDVTGEAADLVIFDPQVGVVYRGPATEQNHSLPQDLEPGLYVVALTVDAYIPEASAVVKGGFSGHGIPLGVEAVTMPRQSAYGVASTAWTEITERAPWSVGFIDDRMFGVGRGDAAWTIEWNGTVVFDSSDDAQASVFVHCAACTSRFGTDILGSTFGPGEYTFEIRDPASRGEAGSYFGYLALDGLLPAVEDDEKEGGGKRQA